MPGRSNCFVFAWWLYLTRGGYCAIRKVRPPLPFGWHWSWSPDRRKWLHYEPISRERVWWRAAVAKVFYRGRIRRYDFEWGTNRTR